MCPTHSWNLPLVPKFWLKLILSRELTAHDWMKKFNKNWLSMKWVKQRPRKNNLSDSAWGSPLMGGRLNGYVAKNPWSILSAFRLTTKQIWNWRVDLSHPSKALVTLTSSLLVHNHIHGTAKSSQKRHLCDILLI